MNHPEMESLLGALERGDVPTSAKNISRISADGQRGNLRRVKRYDTRALFGYLARAEERKPWGFVPEGSAPLAGERGRLIKALDPGGVVW